MNSFRWLGALTLSLALVGCAAPVKKQAFNRDVAVNIKTVLITQRPNQDAYEAAILAHPGMSFGLIGGLVAAADIQSKSNKLTAALNPAETRLQDRFSAKLSEALTVAGYNVEVTTIPKETKEDDLFAVARKKAACDAVVTINLIGSYWAAGPSTDYFPRVLAKVQTIDATSGIVLYEDTLSYGYVTPKAQTIHLASDAQYRFANMEELTKDPAKARDGLYSGLDAIAAQISADLKRN